MTSLCGLCLALLLFANLSQASVNNYRHPFEDAPDCYRQNATAIAATQEKALSGRALLSTSPLDAALPANLGMIVPIAVAGGTGIPWTPAQARWWNRLSRRPYKPTAVSSVDAHNASSPLLNLMAVRTLLLAPGSPLDNAAWPQDTGRFREIEIEDNARVITNSAALPRAYCVPEWQVAESVEQALDQLIVPSFDPRKTCVILADSPGLEALNALTPNSISQDNVPKAIEAQPALCTWQEISPEKLLLHVETSTPGVTVLADTFAPGWHATLDGIAWPIIQTNAMFRGIATPAGVHEIVFEYRPLSFALGRAVSVFGLALLILLTIGGILHNVHAQRLRTMTRQ